LEVTGGGLGATGIGGFAAPGLAPAAGGLGAEGFAVTGGALGLEATGGTTLPLVGVTRSEASDTGVEGFFHGAADPFEGTIPGNTAIGLAEASAVTEVGATLGVGEGTGRVLGGGGGAEGAALGGANSR